MNNVYSITSANRVTAIILAAGEGKRMYSKTPKVLHKVCGIPMLEHVVSCAREIGCEEPVVVVGHGADEVIKAIKNVRFVMQEKQLGTGHAVMQAEEFINSGDVLVLYGDTPLPKPETLIKMHQSHIENGFGATVLTADFDNPSGYGRIVRDVEGLIEAIIEERDAAPDVKSIKEINSGMYFFNGAELKKAIKQLTNNNAQGEYYLTDVIGIFKNGGLRIGAYKTDDPSEIMGINNKLQLSQANEIMRRRILEGHMLNGVSIIDPNSTYIEKTVKIERDAVLYPGTILEGSTHIGEDCIIGPQSQIRDCRIGRGVTIQYTVALESTIGDETTVGPFAYIRPGNKIGKHVRIGDFVEMKNSTFGDHSKASHLTYVGDGDVGSNVNLGCGVVFVNYDGRKKNRTVIEDNCFIGCNVNLIAPVTVKENSYVAAGTTITREVPKESLAIGRAKQENKEGWAKRFK
ncbi:MAG: bifunctional UDP-N-acetylglucosamine diphosphorylase/glucosamine-1-phosphate N-acetyltransferase GlmU [Bacillota bacterium]